MSPSRAFFYTNLQNKILMYTVQAQLGPMQYDNAYKDDWRKPILVKREYDLCLVSGLCFFLRGI